MKLESYNPGSLASSFAVKLLHKCFHLMYCPFVNILHHSNSELLEKLLYSNDLSYYALRTLYKLNFSHDIFCNLPCTNPCSPRYDIKNIALHDSWGTGMTVYALYKNQVLRTDRYSTLLYEGIMVSVVPSYRGTFKLIHF